SQQRGLAARNARICQRAERQLPSRHRLAADRRRRLRFLPERIGSARPYARHLFTLGRRRHRRNDLCEWPRVAMSALAAPSLVENPDVGVIALLHGLPPRLLSYRAVCAWRLGAMTETSALTDLLNAANAGDGAAQDAAYRLVYDELKRQ